MTASDGSPLTLEDVMRAIQGVEGKLEGKINELRTTFEEAQADTNENLEGLKRAVKAVENAPMPYGRPKALFSATDYHSVSGSIRSIQGPHG